MPKIAPILCLALGVLGVAGPALATTHASLPHGERFADSAAPSTTTASPSTAWPAGVGGDGMLGEGVLELLMMLLAMRWWGVTRPRMVSIAKGRAFRSIPDAHAGQGEKAIDATARKRTEDTLRGAQMFRQLAINLPEALWIGDAESGRILYVNPIWEKMTGGRLVAGNTVDKIIEVIHPDDAPRLRLERIRLARGGFDEDCRLTRPDGGVRWVNIRNFPIEDATGKIGQVAGIMEDITARKEAEQRLLQLAHFDPLTGLHNRRHYCELLERALVLAKAKSSPVCVMFIDLDRFKNVNDTLGHALGDDLLCKVSTRMTGCLRTSDTIGRLGGDEFALILADTDPHVAAIVANTIIAELHRPFDLEGHEVSVTASIGISMFPADSPDAATLMKYADIAMYEAKSAGRDTCCFYTAEMNIGAQNKRTLERALRKAIDGGGFVEPRHSCAGIARDAA